MTHRLSVTKGRLDRGRLDAIVESGGRCILLCQAVEIGDKEQTILTIPEGFPHQHCQWPRQIDTNWIKWPPIPVNQPPGNGNCQRRCLRSIDRRDRLQELNLLSGHRWWRRGKLVRRRRQWVVILGQPIDARHRRVAFACLRVPLRQGQPKSGSKIIRLSTLPRSLHAAHRHADRGMIQ